MVRQSLVVRGLAMQGLAMQDLAMQGLAVRPRKLRPILSSVFGLTLGGFALTLLSVGGAPSPAAAFGGMGFGHMGGFGGSGMGMGRSMGPSMRAPVTTPRRGTYIARPPGGTKGNNGNGDGNRWPPRHPVIGHPIIVPIPGGGTPPVANIPPTPPPNGTAGLNGGRRRRWWRSWRRHAAARRATLRA